ncbi:hypothetical protein BaRGS_00017575 [Batillaria attramentaria]|uniref:Uncharacterized protein n=1 Tax=Batillaria attramentaria TaxID=370345 RepID=A0ABD0KV40_9CAEN
MSYERVMTTETGPDFLKKNIPKKSCFFFVSQLETVTWFSALLALTAAQGYLGAGAGLEYGRVSVNAQNQNFNNDARDRVGQRRDLSRLDGSAEERARWAGQSAVRDNALAQNEQALRERVRAANQQFGRNSNNFGNIAKQIRDEALRNQYVIKDDAQYRRNNLNNAEGSNAANARKTAFDRGEALDDNINYVFNKKFDKASSENGGYEEENGRNLRRLDLLDEREKDRKLLRGDSEVSRSQNDEQKALKDTEWKSNAAQKQAQEGKYGFADRRVDQAGERSDDRTLDFDRKDSRYLENETGRDEAVRLAKDLAEQANGYNNQAAAQADANRKVADKKYYGGQEVGKDPNLAGHTGYDGGVAAAAAVVNGDKAKKEGSGGAIRSGFDENAAQLESGNELARANAVSAAQAVNDYQRNRDKLAFDQVRGLQDRTQGQFKQGLQDAASQGFSGNSAEAAKSAAQWDREAAAAQSASDLDAKERNENEALRDRNYYRKLQNDENETFSRRKQFFHNKKDSGSNDENLKYNRKKNARNFGATDEADLAKRNNFRVTHQDGKVANQARNFEDLIDRRASAQDERNIQQEKTEGFENRDANDQARAQAASSGYDRGLSKATSDDSQSQGFNRKQWAKDENDLDRDAGTAQSQGSKAVRADIEYVRPTNGNPLGQISARDLVGQDLLRGQKKKEVKDYKLPDVVVDIKPIDPPPKVEPPKQEPPPPPLPPIVPVKTFVQPKYNKQEVDYNTGRAGNVGSFNRPSFRRIDTLSLFRGPRKNTFQPKQVVASPKSRFNLGALSAPATSSFRGVTFPQRFSLNQNRRF